MGESFPMSILHPFAEWRRMVQHKESGACLYRYSYPGGVHEHHKSLCEVLQSEGNDYSCLLDSNGDSQTVLKVGHFATWDIELRIEKIEKHKSDNLYIMLSHHALSVALSCTLQDPDEEPVYFHSPENSSLVFQKLQEWQVEGELKWHSRTQDVYLQLEEKIARLGGHVVTTPSRFEHHTEQVQKLIRFNALKGLTDDVFDEQYKDECGLISNFQDLAVLPSGPRPMPHLDVMAAACIGGVRSGHKE